MSDESIKKAVPAAQIFPAHWLPLSQAVRDHLAGVFGIKRSIPAEIVNNKIVSDGRSIADLAIVTLEAMQSYMKGSKETDFYRLWELCASKAMSEIQTPVFISASAKVEVLPEVVEKSKKTGLEPISEKSAELANTLMGNNAKNGKSTAKK